MNAALHASDAPQSPADLTADLLVVGWGKAGKTLAMKEAARGRRVVLVEQDDAMIGGTCINIGCVPTKALVHSAAQRRPEDDPATWFAASVDRRDTLIAKLNTANRQMVARHDSAILVSGRARFVAPRTVEVTGGDDALRITADQVVVNTGAVTVPLEVPGLPADSPRLLDSTSAQHADPFPQRLAIVGAGPIGLEFAEMFARFGAEVTLLDRGPRLLGELDEQLADEVEQHLASVGVRTLHDVTIAEVADGPDALTLTLSDGSTLTVDALLGAVGRRPATDGLGLEAAGIAVDERGAIVADGARRTSAEGVWAAGDVIGAPQFTYLSFDDARIILPQLRGGEPSRSAEDRVAVPRCTFLTPPLAVVGLTAQQAQEAGHEVLVASKPVAAIAAMPRPKTLGQTTGRLTVVVDAATDLILGAQLWSVDAQELINLVALAMRAGVTAAELREGIWTHPSTTEALNEVLAEAAPL